MTISKEEFKKQLLGEETDSPEQTELKTRILFNLLSNEGPVIQRLEALEAKHDKLVEAVAKTLQIIDAKFDAAEASAELRKDLSVQLFELIGKRLDSVEDQLNALELEDSSDVLSEISARVEKLEDTVDELSETPASAEPIYESEMIS